MKNKNVIRKKLVNGEFTTIHNSILFDTRLTPNAFRLFTAILSDSDTHFNLSQTLYCKRLGIAKQTFFNAVTKLEECGYLKKTPTGVKNTFNYTLSEYGNLNNENTIPTLATKVDDKLPETNSDSNVKVIQMPSEYYEKLQKFQDNYNDLMCDAFYFDVFKVDIFNGVDYDVIIEKFEKYLYKKIVASVTDSSFNPKSFIEFEGRVKELVFKHKMYNADFMNTWTIFKLTRNRKQAPRDYETEMFDYYENPED
jgi:hypothetical protein